MPSIVAFRALILDRKISYAGQIGYAVLGMKSTNESQVGDTFHHISAPVPALPGFRPAKPMLFAGLYPMDPSELPKLQESVERLMLTDASVSIRKETSVALGQGFRLGFLGGLVYGVGLIVR